METRLALSRRSYWRLAMNPASSQRIDALPGSDAQVLPDTPPVVPEQAVNPLGPPAILEAQATYLRDLPELLKEHRGQWVAYYGTTRIALAATSEALWKECQRQGYREFLVRYIEPHVPVHFISAL